MKHKARLSLKGKITIVVIVFIGINYGILTKVNDMVERNLAAIANQQVETAMNQVILKVLSTLQFQDEVVKIEKDSKGNMISVNYNTQAFSSYLYKSIDTIETAFEYAKEGKEDPFVDKVFFPDGIVYQCPLGYFTGMSIFAGVGPDVPIHMQMLNHVGGEIKIVNEPYGMNNTMVKVILVMKIDATLMSLNHKTSFQIESDIPIVMQIIQGNLPNYVPYGSAIQQE